MLLFILREDIQSELTTDHYKIYYTLAYDSTALRVVVTYVQSAFDKTYTFFEIVTN